MMKKNFATSLARLCVNALFAISLRKFLVSLQAAALLDSDGRRLWMAGLGLSWLVGLLFGLALFAVGYVSSMFGFWSFLWGSARSIEPPVWIFILGDARPQGLLLCALGGILPSLITGRSGWAWVLSAVALYPSVLSLAGAWTLVLCDRLGLWLRLLLSEKKPELKTDLACRTAIAFVSLIGAIFLGAAVRDWVQFNFGGEGFVPETRFVAALVGLALITGVETILAMTFLHFRFIFVAKNSFSSRV